MMIFSIILFSIFVFTSGGVISDNCTKVSLTGEELTTLKDVAGNLTVLNQNLEDGQKAILKVLEELDPSLSEQTKLTNKSSIEDVLQHHMIQYQQLKRMLTEIKRRLLGHKLSDDAISQIKNEIFLIDHARNDSEMKKQSTIQKLDPRNQPERDVYPIKQNNFFTYTDTIIRPSDCSDLLVAGYSESGVYYIYPFVCHCAKPVKAYCDMETEGGGWTVFLNRVNVSNQINFTRNWEDYKNGFGTVGEEHWLGNEALHFMTSSRNYILRMESQDTSGTKTWAEWNSFSVKSGDDKYKLHVTSYNEKSSEFDSFSNLHNNYFSTIDADNDKWNSGSCPDFKKGGWWFNNCSLNNPTGIYGKESKEGITLNPHWKKNETVRYGKMLQFKIRPTVCLNQINSVHLNKHNCI